ncbi:lysozyme inhibitor LprI family protein [Salipiger marinus]|jgi:uncharacterized protein YecT (DUF1311 family)|uniref:Uncharacterized conserved protein YecT, DUF1311 family n=1 Tax=Salipiger marinus TaxID=555512 RepID=A0A1G8MGI1_9RHOB|nr:lysozyme inhibitor LprI family protein [Salipiger marinus]SDI67128.1 Uncharacterized conserved protein YecT, DUF1311 family [Salipiger marinus]
MAFSSRPLTAALAGLVLLALAPQARAACSDATTTVEMGTCARVALDGADAELNRVYAVLQSRVSPERMTGIRDAQRLWIPFRDAACDAEGAMYEGGSMQGIATVTCLTKLTQRRTEDLRALLPN